MRETDREEKLPEQCGINWGLKIHAAVNILSDDREKHKVCTSTDSNTNAHKAQRNEKSL